MRNLDALKQIEFFHSESRGYIALFQKMPSGKPRQYHYKLSDLKAHVDEWRGNDVYMTLNTFKTPSRTNSNIQEFRALYVDLDTYNTEYTNEQVLMHLESDYYNKVIPIPSAVIHSGRGLCLAFRINFAPKQANKRWSYVQKRFVELLAPFGADKAVKDPARILRLGGTKNSKNGETVRIEYLTEEKYELADLMRDYALDHEYIPKKELKERSAARTKKKKKHSGGNIFTKHSLYKARLDDMFRIVELRNGEMNGYREKTLFLCRYFAMHIFKDEQVALNTIFQLNNMFSEPLSRKEVIISTQSAVKAYYLNLADKCAGYNYTNQSLIEELAITLKEQKQLATIISKEEKRARSGHVTWIQHLTRLKKRRQAELTKLTAYMKQHPFATNKQLAIYMECSIRKVQMLKAEIRILCPINAIATVVKATTTNVVSKLVSKAERVINNLITSTEGEEKVIPQHLREVFAYPTKPLFNLDCK